MSTLTVTLSADEVAELITKDIETRLTGTHVTKTTPRKGGAVEVEIESKSHPLEVAAKL